MLPVDITEKRCVVFTARDISDTKRAEELESQNVYLREELNLERSFGDIVGASDAMRAVFKSIEMVAPTDSTVLDSRRNRDRQGADGRAPSTRRAGAGAA